MRTEFLDTFYQVNLKMIVSMRKHVQNAETVLIEILGIFSPEIYGYIVYSQPDRQKQQEKYGYLCYTVMPKFVSRSHIACSLLIPFEISSRGSELLFIYSARFF